MRKTLLYTGAAAVILGAGYVGAAWHIGGVLADETASYEKTLATVDGVIVHRLAYERRLLDGNLHYDIALRPVPGTPLHETLRAVMGPQADLTLLRSAGSLAVRHGPWAGKPALATMDGALALPQALREVLPNYPGQSPWLKAQATIGFSRDLDLRLEGIDYKGRYVQPRTDEHGTVTLAGLGGTVRVGSGAKTVRIDAGLRELSLARSLGSRDRLGLSGLSMKADLARAGDSRWTGEAKLDWSGLKLGNLSADAELGALKLALGLGEAPNAARGGQPPRQSAKGRFELASISVREFAGSSTRFETAALRGELDALQEWPMIWTGKASLSINDASVETAGPASTRSRSRIASLSLGSVTTRRADQVDQTIRLESGPVEIDATRWSGGALELTMRGFDGQALNEILELSGESGFDTDWMKDEAGLARALAAAQRILAGGPGISIDRLSVNAGELDGIRLSASVNLKPAPGLSWEQPDKLLQALEADAALTVKTSALRELAGLAVRAGLAGPSGASTAEVEKAAANQYAQWVALLAQQPLVVAGNADFSSQVRWRAGALTVNGKPMDAGTGLAALGALAGQGGDGRPAATARGKRQAVSLDTRTRAHLEPVRLSANFDPDPRRIEVLAGGMATLEGELGPDCMGHVDPTQADVDLTYRAGEFALFIYADADEDTALIVRAPDGSWHCSDDATGRGIDPLVRFGTPQTGTYKIWVASLGDAGETVPATLSISEADPRRRGTR